MTKIVYSKNAQSFWKQKLYKPNTYSPKKGRNRHTNKTDTRTSKWWVKITLVKQ